MLAKFLSPAFIARTFRFAIVGIASTIIYAALAFGLLAAGFATLWAHSIAYVISILASYAGQKVFTFGIRGQHRRNMPRFIIATIGLAVTQFLLVALLEFLKVDPRITLAISTLYYPPASFVVHNLWTFRGSSSEPAAEA